MLRTRAIAGLALVGLSCILLPTPAMAADESAENARTALTKVTEAARKSASAEPARQADLVTEEDERLIGAELAGRPEPGRAVTARCLTGSGPRESSPWC